MSYQKKYLKYKNKYLALKSKYGYLLNSADSDSPFPEQPIASRGLFSDLTATEDNGNNINVKIIANSMVGGGDETPVTETETTIKNKNTEDSTEVSQLFRQLAGARPKKSKSAKKAAAKHFFKDDSDSDLSESTGSMSDAHDDSEFSSSETDW